MTVPVHASIPDYEITETLYTGSRTLVCRAIRESDQKPVVIKRSRHFNPSFAELLQFQNQYQIAKSLNLSSIVQTYALESFDEGFALVMEDYGGVSLSQYAEGKSLPIGEVLAIAVQLAEALHQLSLHQIIHKDIKPANILIHPRSKQIKLIDFSIATLLPKETQAPQSPTVLEGTLAYLSPEQTGRMNRGIDYRSDFYSFGITLYELLTGALPFESNDPVEWVHFHLAQTATPVQDVNSAVPAVLSQIVEKLMAKNAEDRYQSTIGLKHDLEHCLVEWKETNAIAPFDLGVRDISDRFTIPEKLYGRAVEVETLLAAFDRVAAGSTELMLVAGQSGIGKTAVVNEVHKPIVRQRGYFISGKFDQFQRNIPFSAFVQALRDLIKQLLCQSDRELENWRTEILTAVAEIGQVLIEVIPSLEHIIGPQPAVPALSGSAAQHRFNLVFQKFIRVFATEAHPLVIFIDDLQWADAASLNLLKLLMQDAVGYLFVIGAYRENEVSPAHPFMLTLEEIRQTQATINRIQLVGLDMVALNQLIADTLSCSITAAMPLMNLLFSKTKGNPFFTTQFLRALHDEGLITFDLCDRMWQCDMSQLKAKAITEDVIEFMAARLQRLPHATQDVLKLAACIGNSFDLETLAIVAEQPQAEVALHLWKALQDELLLPVSETYKFFQIADSVETAIAPTVSYKFLHDRVQQAAYFLIPETTKPAVHLKVGELLLAQTQEAELDEKIFAIVNQFNLGTIPPERRQTVAQLNLKAGKKARLASAYEAAAQYCNTGLAVLENAWSDQPELSLELHLEAANAAYLIGEFEQVDTCVKVILQQAKDFLDQIQAIEIQIHSLIARNQIPEAIQTARQTLQKLAVELPNAPTPETTQQALQSTLAQISAIDIFALPRMTDPEKLAAMRILSSMASAAYIGGAAVYPLIVLKQIELSLQFGNTAETAYAYSTYGLLLCAYSGKIEQGNWVADIALELMERYGASQFKAKIHNLVYPFVRIWQNSFHQGLAPLLEGYQAGLESGDLEFAAYCVFNHCQIAYFSGMNLLDVKQSMQIYGDAIAHLNQTTALNFHQIGHQTVLNWLGESKQPDLLIGEIYDATERLPQHQAAGDGYSIGTAYVHKLILAYHFASPEVALEVANTAQSAIATVAGTIKSGVFPFYQALTLLANGVYEVTPMLEQLTHWATHAPMNFVHRCELIWAEQYRLLERNADAVEQYDQAIASAKASGYLQEEALANERAAYFYLNWGKAKVAAGYLQEAYSCYARWGAKAKITALESNYPHLLTPILQRSDSFNPEISVHATVSRSSTTSQQFLDLRTVLKAAEALYSEINLDQLLTVLIQVIVEHTGADKAALFLHQEQGVEVAVKYFDQAVQSVSPKPLQECVHFPVMVIQYVKNTLTTLITDAKTHPSVITDPYFEQHHPKSLLCTPVLDRGKLVGVLYLENSVARAAFTSDRVELLKLLCSQAAISINNAKLYQAMQHQEAQYRGIVEAVSDGLAIGDLETGMVLEANPVYCRMFGYSYAEILQIHPTVMAPLESHAVFADFLAATSAGKEFCAECLGLRRDGTPFPMEVRSVPFVYKGRRCGLSLLRDISDRKTAEAELKQAQFQMMQSEKMSALGSLVAGVAHEINNPVGFLKGNLSPALDYIKDLFGLIDLYEQQLAPNPTIEAEKEAIDFEFIREDLPKLIGSMNEGIERIRQLSVSLRTFSRADSEKPVPFNLHEGLDSTLMILKHRLKAQDHRPEIEIVKHYGDIPLVDCFAGQLNQVFMNIIANAIEAMEEASGNQIQISTAVVEQQVQIRISDTGPGMPEDVRRKIFDHLFTTKAVGKGTGLGLAIAHQIIVEKHRGQLEVNSVPGQGAEFVITLPIQAD